MPTKIYTTNGIFEVSDSITEIKAKLNELKEPPFLYHGEIYDENREVVIMAQELVALEESY